MNICLYGKYLVSQRKHVRWLVGSFARLFAHSSVRTMYFDLNKFMVLVNVMAPYSSCGTFVSVYKFMCWSRMVSSAIALRAMVYYDRC